MDFLGSFVRGLFKVFCASSQQEALGPVYPGAGKPPSPYAQQIQQPGGYSTPYQYPPPQQQQHQWRPPQQPPEPAYSQQQQQERPQHPRPHKPHHGHVHDQSQGRPQGPSPVLSPPPPVAPDQWTSPQPQPQPPQTVVHPASLPRPHGQHDQKLVNSQNEQYVSLRERANREGEAMARAFEESHAAYARKDGAAAKELSNEGKAHQREMERLNAEASAWIFRENNRDCKPGEVDLHGLYVKEAIAYTDQSIVEARARGDREIRLIVGKGIHSPNHAAKLKPAIEELMQKHDLVAEIDPHNAGVLVVQLDGGMAAKQVRDRGGMVLGADDITQRLDRQNGDCILM